MKQKFRKLVPERLIDWYHFSMAFLGALIYGFPSRKLIVIGVTGTKGKTTVVNLAGKILEEAGFKVGWVSSSTIKIGEKELLNPYHMTMPGRFFIQRQLKRMVKAGCRYALIEVTSEGILQHRHRFIDFDTAVFTNLAKEHIEAHKGFDNYKRAKAKLFQATKKNHVVNIDDASAEYLLKFPAQSNWGYSLAAPEGGKKEVGRNSINIVLASVTSITVTGTGFEVDSVKFNINLPGNFNLYNALAALCVGLSQGLSLEVCKVALGKVKNIPGRMEFIDKGQNFTIVVDLAHTPDSFEQIFDTIKGIPHKKVISVFGSAGGGRDKWKRPELGRIAAEHSSSIILTNEDCYDEDPDSIIDQIESGIKNFAGRVYRVIDRREAIVKALKLAEEGDIVLLLGKGTEQTMSLGYRVIPWDDRQIVKEKIQEIVPDQS